MQHEDLREEYESYRPLIYTVTVRSREQDFIYLFIYLCKCFFVEIINGLKNNEFTAMDKTDILVFLDRAFVRLEAWFQWFHTTQSGMLYKCTYVLILHG